MSTNLMEMVKGAVSEQLMGKLGGLLGTEGEKTSSAFDNVAGSILGGMMKKASSEQGAKEVFEMAQNQDAGILDKLGDLLDGDDQGELTNAGGGILDGMLGGDKSGMLEMISKALGLDDTSIGKLMAMVAPIVMAVIGKHIKSKAIDMFGLQSLLGEQGPHLAGSMAPGLGDQLGFSNLVSNVSGAVSNASESVGQVVEAKVHQAEAVADDGGDMLKYVIPLLLLVGLIVAGIFVVPMLLKGGDEGGSVPSITGDNIGEIGDDITKRLEALASETEKVEDVDGANEVVAKIGEFTTYLADMKFGGVTAEDMQGLKGKLDMRIMKPALEKVYEIEGVRDVFAPAIKKLVDVMETIRGLKG